MCRRRQAAVVAVVSFALSTAGCTTSREALKKDPKAVSTSALCRSWTSATDQEFRLDILQELSRRSVTVEQCGEMVRKQNQAIAAGIALAAVGTAVAVCANNNCGGGGYYRPYHDDADWDAFYNQYGQIVWACRSVTTGRFVYESNCYGKAQSDWRWPGPYV
jgi:hypothetical protein